MLQRFVTLVVRKVSDILKAAMFVGGVMLVHPRLRLLWWCVVAVVSHPWIVLLDPFPGC